VSIAAPSPVRIARSITTPINTGTIGLGGLAMGIEYRDARFAGALVRVELVDGEEVSKTVYVPYDKTIDHIIEFLGGGQKRTKYLEADGRVIRVETERFSEDDEEVTENVASTAGDDESTPE